MFARVILTTGFLFVAGAAPAVAWAHKNGVPHVHPHEAVIVVALIVVAIGVQALSRRGRSRV